LSHLKRGKLAKNTAASFFFVEIRGNYDLNRILQYSWAFGKNLEEFLFLKMQSFMTWHFYCSLRKDNLKDKSIGALGGVFL